MGRAPCCDKTKVKRGPWSPEEDNTLKTYVENHGTGGNWIALPQKAGLKRCGKSCRLRWLNYLRPNIKHGGFTEEEDNIILTLYHNIGSRWSVIASQLQGRTDNDVKNYWNTKLKKKLLLSAATTATTTTTTANNNFTNSFNFGVDTNIIHQNNIVPYFPAVVNNSNSEQIYPLPSLMKVPQNNLEKSYHNNNYCGLLFPYCAPLVSEEAISSPSVDNNVNGSGSVEEEDPFLAEYHYLLTNAFDFRSDYHQINGHYPTNCGYSDDLVLID